MQLWKKMQDLLVTRRLVIGKNANLYSTDRSGNLTRGIGAAETFTKASELTAAESGKTIFLNSATEFVTTLPLPAAGLNFTFIVSAAPASASYTIVSNGSSNIILGNVVTSQDAGGTADSETSGGDTITLVDSKAVVGDKVELYCNGTNWFAYGTSKVFDAITITTAS